MHAWRSSLIFSCLLSSSWRSLMMSAIWRSLPALPWSAFKDASESMRARLSLFTLSSSSFCKSYGMRSHNASNSQDDHL